jgi:hypothetical protein
VDIICLARRTTIFRRCAHYEFRILGQFDIPFGIDWEVYAPLTEVVTARSLLRALTASGTIPRPGIRSNDWFNGVVVRVMVSGMTIP